MKKVTVVFKSGVVQEFEVEEIRFNSVVGAIWEEAEGRKAPLFIDEKSIDALFYEEIEREENDRT
ncbi:hypothetical protein O0555_20950 [Brevibacillus laterosporus]|uniref:hypothetical protein n=1 Tax=Brevibacillus laterosporus TaxID=1465 RepID=UPI0011714649|nr:hypothetical protein [Brevibacillus laterosporus]MCR8939771.1 hypothetical protein [Brevibacillus laterosporus]MCZ0842411.1 hypothetical protein [Brevibacillus laterosporus]MCZ0846408.1 hypothetical protein [Brevibacillus laterosporus]TPG70762.1 hypothetical protein EEL31_21490 [Brevibacillus laterosporus]